MACVVKKNDFLQKKHENSHKLLKSINQNAVLSMFIGQVKLIKTKCKQNVIKM